MTRGIFAKKEIQNRFRPRKTSKKQRKQRTRRAIFRRRCRQTHERRKSCADFRPPEVHSRHMAAADSWVNIASAANCRCVAENLRCLFDGGSNLFLCLPFAGW